MSILASQQLIFTGNRVSSLCNQIIVSLFRKESSFNLGSAETKLLYTLHWILMDSADECILAHESEYGSVHLGPFDYLFPLSSITVRLE